MVKEFDGSITDPVKIGDVSYNTLLYADHIVLISESKDGLQNCFNTLSDYCTAKQLEMKTYKYKIFVFNSNVNSFLNAFIYNGINLQTVKQYCYLGITLSYNGNLNTAITLLAEKSRKAYLRIKKSVGLNNPVTFLKNFLILLLSPYFYIAARFRVLMCLISYKSKMQLYQIVQSCHSFSNSTQ